MTWTPDTFGVAAAVVGTLIAVFTLLVSLRDRVRTRIAQETRERAEITGKAFANGAASRDDEVALLRSQRDDARRDRDEAQRRADEYERRYNDLRERRDSR